MALQRFEGTCCDKISSYGFVDLSEAQPEGAPQRLWFSIAEVVGAAPVKGQKVVGSLGVNSKGEVIGKAVRAVPQQVIVGGHQVITQFVRSWCAEELLSKLAQSNPTCCAGVEGGP